MSAKGILAAVAILAANDKALILPMAFRVPVSLADPLCLLAHAAAGYASDFVCRCVHIVQY